MKRILSLLLCLVLLAALALLQGFARPPSAGQASTSLAAPIPILRLRAPHGGYVTDDSVVSSGAYSWSVQCIYDDSGRFVQLRQREAGAGESFPAGEMLDLGGGRWGVIERGLVGHIVLADERQIPYEQAVRLTWVERGVRLELLSNLAEPEWVLGAADWLGVPAP